MPQLIEVKHPTGVTIVFNNKKHFYYVKETGQNLISTTTFIGRFFPYFNVAKISKAYAEKQGLNQKHVRADWDLKKKIGADRGNYCHSYAEEVLTKDKSDRKRIPQLNHIDKVIDSLHDKFGIVWSEVIVASLEQGIAGTIDILGVDHPTILGIHDWKFCKAITRTSRWYAKKPIEQLPNTNYSKYLLQLNLYRHILETEYKGLFINLDTHKLKKSEMVLYHITKEKNTEYVIPRFNMEPLLKGNKNG